MVPDFFIALDLRLTSSLYPSQRVVDFKNTIILFTSNLGASYLSEVGEGPVKPEVKALVTGAVATHFPPEFMYVLVFALSVCINALTSS